MSTPKNITITAGAPSTTAGPTTTTTIVPPPQTYTGTADKFLGCFSGAIGDDVFQVNLGTDGWWHFYIQGCSLFSTETVALHDPPGGPVADAFQAPGGKKCAMDILRTNGSVIQSTPYYTDRVGPLADTGGWIFLNSNSKWPDEVQWRITCIPV